VDVLLGDALGQQQKGQLGNFLTDASSSSAWASVNSPATAASIKVWIRASLPGAVSMPRRLATRVPNRFAQEQIPANG